MAVQFSSARGQSAPGAKVETIRFYQHHGLFEGLEKSLGGIRRYAQVHVKRIRFVREAQELGVSFDDVAEFHRFNSLWRSCI